MYSKDKEQPSGAHDGERPSQELTELRESNSRLIALLNASKAHSIIATGPDGLITVFNSGAERMLGYNTDEMVGKQTPAAFHLESEIEDRGRSLSERFGRTVQGFD